MIPPQFPGPAWQDFERDWQAFEQKHVWHPYAPMFGADAPYPVASAQGVWLKLEDGRELIDGMASWWAAIHGYNHPRLNQALSDQMQQMSHVMFGGLTHRPAAGLAARLIDLTPGTLQHVFFCDSGSVAVEVALKMALQFWQAQGRPEKHRLLTIRHGYHGDTFGAMAVCDPVGGMHHMFSAVLPKHLFAEAPTAKTDADWSESQIADFRRLIETHANEVAAVILEPIVQGAGGMRIYCPEFLRQVRSLCDAHDVLLICDEIATGFGRTGKLFACEHAGISPDIMCLGKALTGGVMSMAATLATTKVCEGIYADGKGVLMHGPTFMANPLACAAASASIDLLIESDWQQRVLAIESQLKEELAPCAVLSQVADVRVIGAIGVLETVDPIDVAKAQAAFIERGVWLRPFGKLAYIMPPYVIEPDELSQLTTAMHDVTGRL